jgi:hypothetical protein
MRSAHHPIRAILRMTIPPTMPDLEIVGKHVLGRAHSIGRMMREFLHERHCCPLRFPPPTWKSGTYGCFGCEASDDYVGKPTFRKSSAISSGTRLRTGFQFVGSG